MQLVEHHQRIGAAVGAVTTARDDAQQSALGAQLVRAGEHHTVECGVGEVVGHGLVGDARLLSRRRAERDRGTLDRDQVMQRDEPGERRFAVAARQRRDRLALVTVERGPRDHTLKRLKPHAERGREGVKAREAAAPLRAHLLTASAQMGGAELAHRLQRRARPAARPRRGGLGGFGAEDVDRPVARC